MTQNARAAFLRSLIDDAGLFPPAALSMTQALAAHVEGRRGPHADALGRFICPASRIEEFIAAFPAELQGLEVSIICDGAAPDAWYSGVKHDLSLAHSIGERCSGRAELTCIEVRLPPGIDGIRAVHRLQDDRFAAGGDLDVFLEIVLDPEWEHEIPHTMAAIAEAGYGAKIRCGGLRADAFPSPAQVARFISAAHDRGVRMKATAGLHHPVRGLDAASGFTMHGFLNVAGAALLAHTYDWDIPAIEQVVWEEEARHFRLDEDAFTWQEYRVDAGAIERGRAALFDAYGSCSFSEPIADLKALGML